MRKMPDAKAMANPRARKTKTMSDSKGASEFHNTPMIRGMVSARLMPMISHFRGCQYHLIEI
jgi:hypothetical protein